MVEDEDKPGMRGMNVAHIQLFFSFAYKDKEYQCALVNRFSRMGQTPDSEKVCGRSVLTFDMVGAGVQ